MSKIAKRNILIAAVSCSIVLIILIILFLLLLSNNPFFKRDYNEDLHVPLKTHQGEIIIKEWSWGLGSGAEIYYKDGKEVFLGDFLAGDNGYCPFEAGFYEFTEDGNTVTIKWCFRDSECNQPDKWHSETFDLPANDNKGA